MRNPGGWWCSNKPERLSENEFLAILLLVVLVLGLFRNFADEDDENEGEEGRAEFSDWL